jgi:hypothetical protein
MCLDGGSLKGRHDKLGRCLAELLLHNDERRPNQQHGLRRQTLDMEARRTCLTCILELGEFCLLRFSAVPPERADARTAQNVTSYPIDPGVKSGMLSLRVAPYGRRPACAGVLCSCCCSRLGIDMSISDASCFEMMRVSLVELPTVRDHRIKAHEGVHEVLLWPMRGTSTFPFGVP